MQAIFAKLLDEMEKHRDTVLVTIVSDQGSAPRGAGSQMLVGAHGHILGTIGGGAVEKKSEELALALLKEKRSDLHQFHLHSNTKEDIGMICGGDVTVLLQYIPWDDAVWNALAGKLLELLGKRKRGWLIQRLDGGVPALLDEEGNVLVGEWGKGAGSLPKAGNVLTQEHFSMPVPVGERAIIFGGGHCALALTPVLKSVGFRVTVMDCRPEFADPKRFPEAEQVICGDYRRIKDYITLTDQDYVVIMTNGHRHDFEVQEQVLRGPYAYVGVIGSRSKAASVNQRLQEAGVPPESIQKVHCPIGLPIKAATPEEIAVSIAGEMICERALRREKSGSTAHGCPMHGGHGKAPGNGTPSE